MLSTIIIKLQCPFVCVCVCVCPSVRPSVGISIILVHFEHSLATNPVFK